MGILTRSLIVAGIACMGCGSPSSDPAASPATETATTDAASPPASPAPERAEGCDLATPAELSAALGSQVGAGESSGLKGCTWTAASGVRVLLEVYQGNAVTCKAQESLVSGREERIAGLGDSALWGSSGDLVVCSARAVVRINLENSRNDPRKDREALVAIGRTILGRL
jgi:hypothetical protein